MTTASAAGDDGSAILPYLLAQAAQTRGHDVFAVFNDGESWTYLDAIL